MIRMLFGVTIYSDGLRLIRPAGLLVRCPYQIPVVGACDCSALCIADFICCQARWSGCVTLMAGRLR
jgi:hypothetical protein